MPLLRALLFTLFLGSFCCSGFDIAPFLEDGSLWDQTAESTGHPMQRDSLPLRLKHEVSRLGLCRDIQMEELTLKELFLIWGESSTRSKHLAAERHKEMGADESAASGTHLIALATPLYDAEYSIEMEKKALQVFLKSTEKQLNRIFGTHSRPSKMNDFSYSRQAKVRVWKSKYFCAHMVEVPSEDQLSINQIYLFIGDDEAAVKTAEEQMAEICRYKSFLVDVKGDEVFMSEFLNTGRLSSAEGYLRDMSRLHTSLQTVDTYLQDSEETQPNQPARAFPPYPSGRELAMAKTPVPFRDGVLNCVHRVVQEGYEAFAKKANKKATDSARFTRDFRSEGMAKITPSVLDRMSPSTAQEDSIIANLKQRIHLGIPVIVCQTQDKNESSCLLLGYNDKKGVFYFVPENGGTPMAIPMRLAIHLPLSYYSLIRERQVVQRIRPHAWR